MSAARIFSNKWKFPAGPGWASAPTEASIDAVAYYSKREVRDMLGLTDRHIARRNLSGLGRDWAGCEKHDGQYVLRRRPTSM